MSDDSTHMRLNQETTSDYGAGAGKGGEVLGISVPELRLAAPVFGAKGKKLSTALSDLVETLDGLGKPWGSDHTGRDFEDRYVPQQKKIEAAAGVLVLGLVSIHEALDDMKDGHLDNDDLVKGIFQDVPVDENDLKEWKKSDRESD
ncbi:hypothetical protein [Streptomyces sulphureus]|uniref:hypothetical protein n=1 Tax=Streptomyces sulphureus TaxID=47758 RepID=UPI0003626612|nr:hypothetical protein [Streptomyces sulphureus]